jgi:hypothetical protein
VTLKKAILVMPKIFFDNRYVFVRNTPTIMDSFFTLRFESIIFFKSQKKISKIFEFSKLS